MPLNVRRFFTSIFLVFVFLTLSYAQNVTPPVQPVAGPTSGDVMRDRISKAKAFIAVRNYNAAIYELENLRKETGDAAVQAVVNVLLMNSYLEQGDFKRAQDFLNEFYNLQKTTKPGASTAYIAIAGQVIKGARGRAERYKALGLSLNDRTLPLEALTDLEKMRETVELVITQSKEIGKMPARTADAMGLLEEATQSRSMIARDDYDAKRWRDEVADAREELANSRTVVMSAVNEPGTSTPNTELVAENRPAQPPVSQPAVEQPKDSTTRQREVAGGTPAVIDAPVYVPATQQPPAEKPKPAIQEPKPVAAAPNTTSPAPPDNSPVDVGSLIAYATQQPAPIYPPIARTMRATGVVRVDVTVNENGEVANIEKLTGPALLQNAAKDAIKKWKFKPFVRDGQPVKATGFVSFNFNL